MAATLITLMQRCLEKMGRYRALSVTSAPSTTVITDTKLRRYVAAADVLNDRFWVYWTLLSGAAVAAADQKRLITDSTTTTATMESATTVTAAADTYLLMEFDPDFLKVAINRAVDYLIHRGLYLPLRNETLVIDNLVQNFSFETSTSGPTAFTNWTSIGTPTLTVNTTRYAHGAQSAQIAATGATEGLEQNLFTQANIDRWVGKTLNVRGWLWATVADAVRMRVTFDGTTFTNGPWHGGDAEWEQDNEQYITVSVPADATEMTVSCEVTDGNTGVFDNVRSWLEPIYRYTLPTALVRRPNRVLRQLSLKNPQDPYVPLSRAYPARPGYILRVEGKAGMTSLSADADSLEVSNDQIELVVDRALVELAAILANTPSSEKAVYLEEGARAEARVEGQLARSNQRGLLIKTDIPDGWDVDETGETRYLVLSDYRG